MFQLVICPVTNTLLGSLSSCCQPSFGKVLPPSFEELGVASLISIYNELSELGRPPTIVDAAELQQDPEVGVRAL